MFNMLEIAITAIVIAWPVLFVYICLGYVNIRKEQREIGEIKERVGHTEDSMEKIKGQFAAIKSS